MIETMPEITVEANTNAHRMDSGVEVKQSGVLFHLPVYAEENGAGAIPGAVVDSSQAAALEDHKLTSTASSDQAYTFFTVLSNKIQALERQLAEMKPSMSTKTSSTVGDAEKSQDDATRQLSLVSEPDHMCWRRFMRMTPEEKLRSRHVLEICCEAPRKLESEPVAGTTHLDAGKLVASKVERLRIVSEPLNTLERLETNQIDAKKLVASKVERLRIVSKPLNSLLEKLLEVEDGMSHWLSHVRPFKALLLAHHGLRDRYSELCDQIDNEKEEEKELREHLDCLIRFMDGLARPLLTQHDQLSSPINIQDTTKISFNELWSLYQPGRIIYKPRDRQAYIVMATRGGRPLLRTVAKDGVELDDAGEVVEDMITPFTVEALYLRFNGKDLGPIQEAIKISHYDGPKQITSLPVFPIEYGNTAVQQGQGIQLGPTAAAGDESPSTEPTLLAALQARGRKFIDLAVSGKPCHREYSGFTLDKVREQIDSQVIVDFDWYYKMRPDERPELGTHEVPKADWRELEDEVYAVCACDDPTCFITRDDIYDDRVVDGIITKHFRDEHSALFRFGSCQEKLKQEYAYLLPRRVFAFVLRTRAWHALDIDCTTLVKQNTESFGHLVLPTEHKKIVEAVVRTHHIGAKPVEGVQGDDDPRYSDDLVRGKGEGIIMLLHGAPGVGKTSTAETVAELTGRPLFALTCGDIGDNAKDVQASLDASFKLAHRWGCVMLLDEADVFLQQRSRNDMQRNAIVSVFLRVLEYYSGILFLTTNKIGTFDEAFKSRIHVALYYKQLDRGQTERIWLNNFDRVQRSRVNMKVDKEELIEWVKTQWKQGKKAAKAEDKPYRPWNGRQIHNACQTAAALAEYESIEEKKPLALTIRALDAVAAATAQFDEYLLATHGMDASDLAHRAQDRGDDDFHHAPVERSHKGKSKSKKKQIESSSSDVDDSE